jgi:DNA-binding beta-propeller fold protein YncE
MGAPFLEFLMKKYILASWALCSALVLTACGGGGSGAPTASTNTLVTTSTTAALTPGISLIAGNMGSTGNLDGTSTAARFNVSYGLAIGSDGTAYIADTFSHTIRKINAQGVVSTVAGISGSSGATNGTPTAARFSRPYAIAVDSAGNLFVADTLNHAIRKIATDGMVSTFAGTAGSSGTQDGSATVARFNQPQGLAWDNSGNLLVADTNNQTIRKITPAGDVSTLAGVGGASGTADGTPTQARFNSPTVLATDISGNIYIGDSSNYTIRKMTPAGDVSTFSGVASSIGFSDGTATQARYGRMRGMAVDSAGAIWVSDQTYNLIRKIDTTGSVTTIAGSATSTIFYADGAASASAFDSPTALAFDSSGALWIADSDNSVIRKLSSGNMVSTVAGLPALTGSTDAAGSAARFDLPIGVARDVSGNLYVADRFNHTIRKIASNASVTTVAGSPTASGLVDAQSSAARFNNPTGVVADAAGNLYVADSNNHNIRKIDTAGNVSVFAGGTATSSNFGNVDGTGTLARFNAPYGMAIDLASNLYVTERGNHKIRKITSAGVVSTLAGSGSLGNVDGNGTSAQFNNPISVAVDASGNVFVAERNGQIVRKILPNGDVSTLAGSYVQSGSTDGTGSAARFNTPSGIAVDNAGNVYVADLGNHTIRKITSAGVVSTLVGKAGSGGVQLNAGLPASLYQPQSVMVETLKTDGSAQTLVVATANGVVRITLP